MNLRTLAVSLPETPGIYKMTDIDGRVIYVGKAKNLRTRVKSYFQKDYAHSTRTQKLVVAARDIAVIQTDSELEALLLENNLIKELRPKYNILMKDDKSFVYIKVNLSEDFPRIRVIREREINKDRAANAQRNPKIKYYGPKIASGKVYDTLRLLKKLFPYRHCQLDIKWEGGTAESPREQPRVQHENLQLAPNKDLVEVTNRVIDFPCLDYFIKRCPGPCIGAISPDPYKKLVQQITDFLEGKSGELEKSLKAQMMEAAAQKLFEKAAKIRDKLKAIEEITERQKITTPVGERVDTDIINFTTDLGRIYVAIFMIRGGKLVSQENFVLDAFEMKESDAQLDLCETLESFLTQYYERAAQTPKEILIPDALEDTAVLEKWLTERRGDMVRITNPQKGEKNKLLELALKNAVTFSKQYRIKWMAHERGETALARLGEVLQRTNYIQSLKPNWGGAVSRREKLSEGAVNAQSAFTPRSATERNSELINRIEGYDISHLGGNETVGSMVVFENGVPKSEHYRHFKMRTVMDKPDDYRSMEEVLMRRLKYLKKPENISLKKATKKDFEEIGKIIKREKLSVDALQKKNFVVAKKENIMIGFGRILTLDPKVSLISSLWIAPEERGRKLGYTLMKKLIAVSKLKRIYVSAEKEFEEYYAEFGFIALREPPAPLKARIERIGMKKNVIYMVYDAKKHKDDPSFASMPNLIIVDGGKGQLSTALLVLKRLQLGIPVIGLAKRLEEIYLPGEKAPLLLNEGDEALKLLQRVRDEAHRFAITFQRKLHLKNLIPQ